MTVQQYLDEHMGMWSPNTVDTYQSILSRFEIELDVEHLTAGKLRAWIYSHGWGSSQRYVALSAAKGYIKWAFGAKHPALILNERRAKSPPQRALKIPQIKDLLSSFNTMEAKGIRDLAMCALMLDTGLRASEICKLDLHYLDMEERKLRVVIKGGRWAMAMFSISTQRYMEAWLAIRQPLGEPVFLSVGGIIPGTRLTRSGLRIIVKKWGKDAGIGLLSPHDLRRTFAVTATRLGAPSRLVQLAGRWSSIEMVERYTETLENEDFEKYFPVEGLGF